ncbi:MAG: hypothetical protein QW292_01990 [Candidatus Parvarchaeota archaeon]
MDHTREGQVTGYDIYRKLKGRYPNLTAKLVYYYLSKMRKAGLVSVQEKQEEGRYSWGGNATKKYYRST